MTDDNIHTPCPYTTIGADITITHSLHTAPPFEFSENAISSLSAVANKHLQKFERRKFMRCNKRDNNSNFIAGDAVIGELIRANMILLPFAIDPHGRWGPITQSFLSTSTTASKTPLQFPTTRPHALTMYNRATTHPTPTNILHTADEVWKLNKTRRFFGHSYTAPTPQIHTIQNLGLGITKAFSLHLRNSIKRSTTSPIQYQNTEVTSPTSHRSQLN